MSYYDAMRDVMDHAIEHDICNLYFFHVMMGLINKAESEHKFLYDEFMNDKGDRIKAENAKLRKENDDLRRLANIDAMMIFLSRNCSFKDCEKCDVNPLCEEAVYLQGLYGIDKYLACGADMRWKLLEGISSDNALIGWGESGTEADDD